MSRISELDVDPFVSECVEVNQDDVNSDFIRLPADLAYWNKRYADALRAEMRAKHAMKKTYAERSLVLREELAESGGRITEAMVESAVLMDVAYQQSYLAHVDAVAERTEISGWVEAIKAKKDALVTLGANIRAEHKGLSINSEEELWKK